MVKQAEQKIIKLLSFGHTGVKKEMKTDDMQSQQQAL